MATKGAKLKKQNVFLKMQKQILFIKFGREIKEKSTIIASDRHTH